MCCGKNSSSATCGHGAEIACMKEDDNRIKGMLLDMENKDVVKAAEKGNKTQQL